MPQFTITQMTPRGEKLHVVKGTIDDKQVVTKCWNSSAYFAKLEVGKTYEVELEERTQGEYTDLFLKSSDGTPEKEKKNFGGGGGGGGGRPARPIGAEGADIFFKAVELAIKIAATGDHPIKLETVRNGTAVILEDLAKHAKKCNTIAEGK